MSRERGRSPVSRRDSGSRDSLSPLAISEDRRGLHPLANVLSDVSVPRPSRRPEDVSSPSWVEPMEPPRGRRSPEMSVEQLEEDWQGRGKGPVPNVARAAPAATSEAIPAGRPDRRSDRAPGDVKEPPRLSSRSPDVMDRFARQQRQIEDLRGSVVDLTSGVKEIFAVVSALSRRASRNVMFSESGSSRSSEGTRSKRRKEPPEPRQRHLEREDEDEEDLLMASYLIRSQAPPLKEAKSKRSHRDSSQELPEGRKAHRARPSLFDNLHGGRAATSLGSPGSSPPDSSDTSDSDTSGRPRRETLF